MDEINLLVAEYNTVEQQQAARLRELFALLKARQGRRFIRFDGPGAPMLDNCWNMPDSRLDELTYLHKFNRAILEVCPGHDH